MRIGWKTVTGALIWAVGTLSQPEVLNVLPGNVATVVTVVGGVLGALGVRHAIAKNGSGR